MRIINPILFALLICVPLTGSTWTANPGDNLQLIIDQMTPGDKLIVSNGEYSGSLLINKRIFIQGKNTPIINGELKGDVILVKADSVVIDGLEVQWSGTHLLDDEAGIKIEGDDVIIKNCRLMNTLHGIYVKGGNRVIIKNNYIHGRADLIEALRGNGIHLWNSKNNLVEGNEIEQARDGIYFSFADETDVLNNHIHHLRYGLHYMYSDDNYFGHNLFENNVAGAALMYSKRIHFNGNIFAHNRGYRAYGVLYQSCDYITAKNNLIINNTRGLYFDASNYNEFWNNAVVANDIAVHINASCEENKLYKNNFIENLSGLVVDAKGYPNYWADEGKGNYWSGYPGYDLDGDGIGDEPYRLQSVFEYLESGFPEVRLYLFSPAAQILEAAERVFPILHPSEKKDPLPLMKPVEIEGIPWELLQNKPQEASVAFLILFGIFTLTPIILISWNQK